MYQHLFNIKNIDFYTFYAKVNVDKNIMEIKNMINIIICDDNEMFLHKIQEKIKREIAIGNFGNIEYNISAFSHGNNAIDYCTEQTTDIAFLDIDMPQSSGFDVADTVHERNNNAVVIFVTDYDNYVYSSFKHKPFRFIRKEYINTELPEALNSALNDLLSQQQFITLGNKDFNKKIFASNIIYFESKKNYVEIVCFDGNRYTYRSTISDLEQRLAPYFFVKIHAAYVVNMKYIQKIDKNEIELCNGEKINISQKHYSQVHKSFAEYLRR